MRLLIAALVAVLSACATPPAYITNPVEQAEYRLYDAELTLTGIREEIALSGVQGRLAGKIDKYLLEAETVLADARLMLAEGKGLVDVSNALEFGIGTLTILKDTLEGDEREYAELALIGLRVAAREVEKQARLAEAFPGR